MEDAHKSIVSTRADVQIRPATATDHAGVASTLIESRRAFMPYAPSAHSEPDVRDWVQNVLLPSGAVTVAMVDGAVAGVLATGSDADYRWIRQLWVVPSLVGHGIGSELLRHALAHLQPPVRLYTFQANAGARRFYERNGFKAIALTDGRDNEERCPDVLFECQSCDWRAMSNPLRGRAQP
jgi:ribosomal protein S18 acetylase RimI-like enzyme